MTNFRTVANGANSTQGFSAEEMERLTKEEKEKELRLLVTAQLKAFSSQTFAKYASRTPSQPPVPPVTEQNTYDANKYDNYVLLEVSDGTKHLLANGYNFIDTNGRSHNVAVVWIEANPAAGFPVAGYVRIEGQASMDRSTGTFKFQHWGIVKSDGSIIKNFAATYDETSNK